MFRVYYDRLVDDEDRAWLTKYVKETFEKEMKENFNQVFSHLDFDQTGNVTEDDLRSLVFCDFQDPKNENKNYVEVADVEKLRSIVESHLDEFNNLSKKPMNLVMFRWVWKICGDKGEFQARNMSSTSTTLQITEITVNYVIIASPCISVHSGRNSLG